MRSVLQKETHIPILVESLDIFSYMRVRGFTRPVFFRSHRSIQVKIHTSLNSGFQGGTNIDLAIFHYNFTGFVSRPDI